MPWGKHENKLKQQSQLVDLYLRSGNPARLKFWFSFCCFQLESLPPIILLLSLFLSATIQYS